VKKVAARLRTNARNRQYGLNKRPLGEPERHNLKSHQSYMWQALRRVRSLIALLLKAHGERHGKKYCNHCNRRPFTRGLALPACGVLSFSVTMASFLEAYLSL